MICGVLEYRRVYKKYKFLEIRKVTHNMLGKTVNNLINNNIV